MRPDGAATVTPATHVQRVTAPVRPDGAAMVFPATHVHRVARVTLTPCNQGWC